MRNVVITGTGIISDLGTDFNTIYDNMLNSDEFTTSINVKVTRDRYVSYPAHIIARHLVQEDMLNLPVSLSRIFTPASLFAYQASLHALEEANLLNDSLDGIKYHNPLKVGISLASSLAPLGTFERTFEDTKDNPKSVPVTDFFKTINNSITCNIANAFNVKGRVISPTAACATSLQSIILGYEAIRHEYADMVICGGAEEYHSLLTLIFNRLAIASETACKPFQEDRDGIVVGEGAGIVILEAEDIARNRGANILADVLSTGMTFSQCSAYSDSDSILECMLQATQHSRIEYVDAIDAHATGTRTGDAQEAEAIAKYLKLYPNTVKKTTALKRFFGHTMAACGAIELIISMNMMKHNKQLPVCTEDELDPLIPKEAMIYTGNKSSEYPFLLKNSFGLGGINASLLVSVR